MKRLNQILQSRFIYYFIILFSFFYIFFFTKIIKYESNLSGEEQSLIGTIDDIDYAGKYVSINLKSIEKVKVIYYGENISFKLGDNILFYGYLERPLNNTIPNQFNYKKYLYNEKIYYIMKSKKYTIISNTNNVFYKFKNYLIHKIQNSKSPEYLSTFILGKNILNKEINKVT